jgi:hypothetical protein
MNSTPKFWKQWLISVFVLIAVAMIVLLGFPQLHDAYVVEIYGAKLQKQLGFKTVVDRHGRDMAFYISTVEKGGVFDKAGIKPGFIPFGYMHGWENGFYGQLEGDRGGKTTLRFIEAAPDGKDIIHSIEIEVPLN